MPYRLSCASLALLIATIAVGPGLAVRPGGSPVHYDIVIRGGEIVDGTGGKRFRGDIGIRGEVIAAIGDLSAATADRIVDAKARIVTPGFIDMHAHVADDEAGEHGFLSTDPRLRAGQNYVAQGVTTVLGNPDGAQPFSLRDEGARMRTLGIGTNIALTNGHNGLRALLMRPADTKRPANDDEIRRMQDIIRHDMACEGSFGLSLGLEYDSGRYADRHELIKLGRALPAYDGIFIPHLRSQGIAPMWYLPSTSRGAPPPTLDQSIDEILAVAHEAGATVVFTHMKAWGPGYRGEARRLVAKLQAARDRGDRVFMDVYPYDSSGSDGDFVAIPRWAFGADGATKPPSDYRTRLDRLLATADSTRRADLIEDIRHFVALKGGPENIVVLAYPDRSYVGKRLSELMALRKLDLPDLILALQREGDPSLPGGARMRAFSMLDDDIKTFYRQPWAATSTDGWIILPEEATGSRKYINTNRRLFGSFPRRIAYYSQQQGVDTLEQAVHSMTALPATILHIGDRGRIAVGMKADVTVIDLPHLRDNTTALEPSVYPDGIDYVLVNGRLAVDRGKRTLALAGKVLSPDRRPDQRCPTPGRTMNPATGRRS